MRVKPELFSMGAKSMRPSDAMTSARARAMTAALSLFLSISAALACASCGSNVGAKPPPPPPCDQACMDATALRAMREGMKLVFNVTLQGKPVGAQDATVPCPLGGTAHVFGQATSNAVQGATNVALTYVLDHCGYSQTDTDPKQTYSMTLTGTITEDGTLAVQPSASTALEMKSDAMTFSGTVYDPPITYDQSACPLVLGQNGNQLSGTICGRTGGLTL
jgi:hypothetical protein